tara:strand:+ start:4718 stop:6100 length:1383 start_codon:yes stop_codon:yes gene_type:complete
MFLIEKILNIKKIYYKLILILSFIISWTSIGTHYTNLLIFTSNEGVSLVEVINFIRITAILFFFPILCIMLFTNISQYKRANINPYLALFIPLLCLLSQIPGLFYTPNSLWNILYVLSAINILITLNLIILNFENDELYFIIFVTFYLLLIVFFISFKQDITRYINSGHLFYGRVNYIIGDSHIRSSGTSRIALILLIIYLIFFVKFFRYKILQIIPLIFFCAAIILYQSRASIGLATIFITLNYLILEKYTLITFFKYLLIYFVMPTLLTFLILSLQIKQLDKFIGIDYSNIEGAQEKIDQEKIDPDYNMFIETDVIILKNKLRFFKPDQINSSSGRMEDWKAIIYNFDYNNNLFFGYGAQGDRYLINQTASNALMYVFVSSGFVGLVFFTIITLKSSIQIMKYIFFNKQKISIYYFSFIIMIIILIRSLIETSYSLFSVDFILFYTAFILMQRNESLK